MMNRLGSPRASFKGLPAIGAKGDSHVESGSYARTKTADRQPIALFTPIHYEANYAYPLVVWLHGPGDDEGQLKRILPLISLRNYVGVSVRGVAPQTSASGRPGFTWPQTQPHVVLADQRVAEAVNLAQSRWNIAKQRIFLAGFDCGGTLALRLALAHPARFAGVLSLGGEFPVGGAPLAHLTDARRVPIFLACSRASHRYPSALVCENLKLLHSAGMNLTLREYPGGHELSARMLADMDRWIMDLVTGNPPSDQGSAC